MISQTSQGVNIGVEVFYNPAQSNVLVNQFTFVYRITIVNYSANVVKLLRRHWHIIDSLGTIREVEGEGVIGEKPVLVPNEKFVYISGVNISTEMGSMFGNYTMQNMHDKKEFQVSIPKFNLEANFKLN